MILAGILAVCFLTVIKASGYFIISIAILAGAGSITFAIRDLKKT